MPRIGIDVQALDDWGTMLVDRSAFVGIDGAPGPIDELEVVFEAIRDRNVIGVSGRVEGQERNVNRRLIAWLLVGSNN